MTRYVWTKETEPTCDPERPHVVYRLRAEGYRNHCVSLWLEVSEWFVTFWHCDGSTSHGKTPMPRGEEVAMSVEGAKREAVSHAKRIGLIGQSDEVIE